MKRYPIYNVATFGCNSGSDELYFNTLEKHLESHSFIEEPHRHNSFLLVFFTHGTGKHVIDFDEFEVKQGSLFLLKPGQMHHWELSEDVKGHIVIWSASLYNLYFGKKQLADYPFFDSNFKPEILFSEAETKAILPYFDLLLKEDLQTDLLKTDKILNLLDCIQIEIARKIPQFETHHSHPYNLKIREFEQLVETYFRTQKSPSFYASKLNITLKHLSRISKEMMQKTATDVITERVILEAKRMLTDRKLLVNEVAERLGYDDYSYFARVFKKASGTSPTAFQSQKR